MRRRTTIELDERLLGDAQRVLGCSSMRQTVERALRIAVEQAAEAQDLRGRRVRAYLDSLAEHADPVVLGGDEMWR